MYSMLPIKDIFMSPIPKTGEFGRVCPQRMRGKVFILKNHRDLKINLFVETLQIPSFYFKEQSPKRKFKI